MKSKIFASAILCFLGALGSSKAQEAGAGSLGYFVGYHAAILELQNGKKFCASAEVLKSWKELMNTNAASVDAKKPAKGIVAVLAKAYPCVDAGFTAPRFSSTDIARALLRTEIGDDVTADKEFNDRYSIGMLVAVADLEDGDSFCIAGSKNKISDVLAAHQQAHPDESFSTAFVLDAFREGFPCRR